MTWEDLTDVMTKTYSWNHVILESETQIFDPFVQKITVELAEQGGGTPLKAQGYLQKVYWQKKTLLAIETMNLERNLLHFYYYPRGRGNQVSIHTQTERNFSDIEVLPPFLVFQEYRTMDWNRALKEMNIHTREVSLYKDAALNVFYQVGDEENFILIEKDRYRIHSIYTTIHTSKKSHQVTIRFREFVRYRRQNYPKVTEYYVDGYLFKRTTISQFSRPARLPHTALYQLAKKWHSPSTVSIKDNYAK